MTKSAMEILDARLARGEITIDEYARTKAAIEKNILDKAALADGRLPKAESPAVKKKSHIARFWWAYFIIGALVSAIITTGGAGNIAGECRAERRTAGPWKEIYNGCSYAVTARVCTHTFGVSSIDCATNDYAPNEAFATVLAQEMSILNEIITPTLKLLAICREGYSPTVDSDGNYTCD